MTTETQNQPAKQKQVPDFYIFENGNGGNKPGKPAGACFAHKKGKGFTILMNGKRYAAFPPKAKTASSPETSEEQGA